MKTTTVAFLGTPGAVARSFERSTGQNFQSVGRNTGNLAFQYAMWEAIRDPKIPVDFDFDPAWVKERCSVVVVPAANFLYSGFDLGGLADRLEATGLPIFVAGLGMQAFRSPVEVTLKPGTDRLLRVMASHEAPILVRGHYTADVLDRYGIRNFRILGCPSNFISSDVALGASLQSRLTAGAESIAFAPTFYHYNADWEGKVYSSLIDDIALIVAQDPEAAVDLARGSRTDASRDWLETSAGFLSQLSERDRTAAARKLAAYFSAEAWLEAYQAVDLVVGSRIHGAVLGWQAGRPGIVLSYDLRTEELASTMSMPFIKIERLPERPSPAFFEEEIARALHTYDARRRELAGVFIEALETAGLTPAPRLEALTGDGAPASAIGAKTRFWGFLEQYNRRVVSGWVAAASEVAPPSLSLRIDDKHIATDTPHAPRSDIKPRGWAFSFDVPHDLDIASVATVAVQIADSREHIRNSPVTVSFLDGDEKKVLRGKDGYLFLQNDTNAVLDQLTGKRPLTARELEAWRTHFQNTERWTEQLGARIIELVAPCKASVLESYLPDDLEVSVARPVHQLIDAFDALGLSRSELLYPLAELKALSDARAYSKGDTHWTDVGAAAVAERILARLGRADNAAAPTFQTEFRNADLLGKLGGICVEQVPVAHFASKAQKVEDNGAKGNGRYQRYVSKHPAAEGRLLFAHDSFGEWLIPHLAVNFRETHCFWSPSVSEATIGAFLPEVILFERAERFIILPPKE